MSSSRPIRVESPVDGRTTVARARVSEVEEAAVGEATCAFGFENLATAWTHAVLAFEHENGAALDGF